MQIIDYLERRVIRLDQGIDATNRRRMVTPFIPSGGAILSSAIWGIVFFMADVPVLGVGFVLFALLYTVALAISINNPKRTDFVAGLVGALVLIFGFIVHGLTGGVSGGFWQLAYVALTPLTVFLASGPRLGAWTLGGAVLIIAVAVVLDPWFAASPLPVPDLVKHLYSAFVLATVAVMGFLWSLYLFGMLQTERRRSESLLLNVLPPSIAERLKREETTIADGCEGVTVLFADIVDFTTMSANADPVEVVGMLNDLFSQFDDLAAARGLEKIKTIGDAYMVAGGLPDPRADHCQAVVDFAFDILAAASAYRAWDDQRVQLRVGINTGSVVAGVIGRHKFIYDMWGDAVNTASRMESYGIANRIQVTAAVRECLGEGDYVYEPRGPIDIKGKGSMTTFMLSRA